jgi:hypothetical protein
MRTCLIYWLCLTVNEVEYNFDIDINYEVKSGKNLVNVKGSLKNHCQFWKNVVNASDYILNVFVEIIGSSLCLWCLFLGGSKFRCCCGTFKGAESSVDYSRNIFQQTVVVVPDCRPR